MKTSKGFSKTKFGRGKKDTRRVKKSGTGNKRFDGSRNGDQKPSMFVEHRNR